MRLHRLHAEERGSMRKLCRKPADLTVIHGTDRAKALRHNQRGGKGTDALFIQAEKRLIGRGHGAHRFVDVPAASAGIEARRRHDREPRERSADNRTHAFGRPAGAPSPARRQFLWRRGPGKGRVPWLVLRWVRDTVLGRRRREAIRTVAARVAAAGAAAEVEFPGEDAEPVFHVKVDACPNLHRRNRGWAMVGRRWSRMVDHRQL